MKPLCAGAALSALLAVSIYAPAQEPTVQEMEINIRLEGMSHSQIMRTLHFFTDVFGPRLTGSPNLRSTQEWALEQLQTWGLKNAHLESWDFARPGWSNDRISAWVISPYKRRVACEVLAWTPGTKGVVSGEAYLLDLPAKPTADDLKHFLEVSRGSVKGKVVFVGKAETVPVTISPSPRRPEDASVRAMFDPDAAPAQPDAPARQTPDPSRPTPDQITEMVDAFLLTNQALVKVMDTGREHLQIRAFASNDYDLERHIPSVVFSNEDYGRVCRVLADSTPVRLEFDIANQVHPDGSSAYNAVAEIPGTDKADEVIMLGAHLDSWHAATGATASVAL
jgi:carboxypeptidase Q